MNKYCPSIHKVLLSGVVMPKREETRIKSFRLPGRLWALLEKAAADIGRKPNNIIWRLLEDYLVGHGYLKDEDRKRETLE